MKVDEVFLSNQGEGPDVGVSTVFARLSGCNIQCNW
jgi:organic radical activating enzyme